MKIADIPFNRHIALELCDGEKGVMRLKSSPEMANHLGTIHASAQFALAEACSGQFMLGSFPEYADDYVAVLRKSQVRYKSQTKENIYGLAESDEDAVSLFRARLERKQRSLIPVRVILRDEKGEITMEGTFDWFVAKRQQE